MLSGKDKKAEGIIVEKIIEFNKEQEKRTLAELLFRQHQE